MKVLLLAVALIYQDTDPQLRRYQEQITANAGECPVCGMALVPKYSHKEAQKAQKD